MTIKPLIAAALLATSVAATPAFANHHADKSASMPATMNIAETAMAVDDLSTLVAAVKAADLVGALTGDGPLTVFAPTNAAFDALPDGTVATLLKPENKDTLSKILTSHVVAGSWDAKTLTALAEANDGKLMLPTLSGAKLKVKMWEGKLYIKDEKGGKASVAMADVMTSNGTVHVVSSVLLPK
jgi:uncharacterized surface protein with fasciclin (FAS1) repeats